MYKKKFSMYITVSINFVKFREEAEHPICSVANYLYCGIKVIGGAQLCLNYLEQNSNRYQIQVCYNNNLKNF